MTEKKGKSSTMSKIRIGTRGSRLALKQAAMVQEALAQTDDGIETEIVILHTKGDKILDKPLGEIGDKGVFVSEFEQALLKGEIDLAVHSAKDLPMRLAKGLTIAAVLPRGDVRDVLVTPKGGRMPLTVRGEQSSDGTLGNAEAAHTFEEKFVLGTGSRRRQQQAGQIWKNVVCENIRGNVDTRLRKLKDSQSQTACNSGLHKETADEAVVIYTADYDGIILAKAGLDRMEIMSEYGDAFAFYPLAAEQFLPAACQGIIAVEAVQDSAAAVLCRKITDAETELCFLVEREVLTQLSADCSDAAAAWCRREQEELILDVMYAHNRVRHSCAARTQSEVIMTQEAEWEALLRTGLEMARRAAKTVKEKVRI